MKLKWISAKDSNVVVGFEGKQIECIDFTSGIFAANTGHSNKHVLKAVKSVPFLHSYNHETSLKTEYKEKLLKWTGYEDCAFFSDGTTAVEAAIRIMKTICDGEIYGIKDCFHGKSWGAQNEIVRKRVIELKCKDHDAFMFEGYCGFDAKFWEPEMVQDAYENGTVCFDEIQSGFGRTGKKFAFEHYGIDPDFVVVGKAMGSGFPVSGILSSMSLEPFDLSSTHGGNPMAMASGIATIEEFERLDLIKKSESLGNFLHYSLESLPLPVTGKGMVAAIHFLWPSQASMFCEKCLKKGLLLVETGKNTVKIGPPLVISKDELKKGIDIIKDVFFEWKDYQK